MTLIRVEPEVLDTVARSLIDSADEVERCGRKLLSVAASAPSYDGQYGPWLEAMAAEDEHDARLLAEEIRQHADDLLGLAGAFRDADALFALGHPGWATAIQRMVEAGYRPSGLAADWYHTTGHPPQISQEEWDQLSEQEKQAMLQGVWDPQWLWANPAALAFVLTDTREGREYLEKTALPQLSNSPTGRAVVEALLEHAPVAVVMMPQVLHDPQRWLRDGGLQNWLRDHGLDLAADWLVHSDIQATEEWIADLLEQRDVHGINANLQPAFTNIIMLDPSQPGYIFAHEAVHLLARASGVDPATAAGEWELRWERPWPGDHWWRILGDELQPHQVRPGYSLQMEREAMIVDTTIQLELMDPTQPNAQIQIDKLTRRLRTLAGYDANAAFDMIKTSHSPYYDDFPPGNDPPRHWRADLLALGLGPEVIEAIDDSVQSPPPPRPPH